MENEKIIKILKNTINLLIVIYKIPKDKVNNIIEEESKRFE